MTLVLGIDPGAKYTGIVLVEDDKPLQAQTVARQAGWSDKAWIERVVTACDAVAQGAGERKYLVAVEGLRRPQKGLNGRYVGFSPKVMEGVMEAAVAYAAVLAVYEDAHVVAPNRNGEQRPADEYPAELVRGRPTWFLPNEAPRGTRQHERSAFDVALGLLRQQHLLAA